MQATLTMGGQQPISAGPAEQPADQQEGDAAPIQVCTAHSRQASMQ